MKKNVFFVVVDSMSFDKIKINKFGNSLTPFLDSQREHCLFATNLYSQGPFTESGNKALLTGDDSLNNGGYMYNLNSAENAYLDVFKNAGYEIYEFFLPYYLYSNKHFKNIDHQFFTSDFLFVSVWDYRLKYFADIFCQRELLFEELENVMCLLELVFQSWINFLNIDNDDKYVLLERLLSDYDWSSNLDKIKLEYEDFRYDKQAYAKNVLSTGLDHSLFKIETFNYGDFVDNKFLKDYFYSNRRFVFQLKIKQFFYNLKNNKIDFKKLIQSMILSAKGRKIQGYFKQVVFILFCGKFVDFYKSERFHKSLPSARKMLRTAFEQLNKNREKPFFVHLHPEDLHNRTSFFSYDIFDKNLIKKELSIYEEYMNSISSDYQGELIYDFSILYIDDCIKELYENLNGAGLLKDTIIVITADHGYSYNCTPLRDEFVNNVHTENYHIPFLVIDQSRVGKCVDSYHTSKDVLPTIYELCDIPKPLNISGTSLLDDTSYSDFAISEYMGTGCPDMRLRPIVFIIRSKYYLFSYEVCLSADFNSGRIREIYDLVKDPMEEFNLVNLSYDIEHAKYLLNQLEKRFLNLKRNYHKFMRDKE